MPPGTISGRQEKQKNVGVLAGVAKCGRSQKWGYGGGCSLGFKQKGGPPCGLGTAGENMGPLRDYAGQ